MSDTGAKWGAVCLCAGMPRARGKPLVRLARAAQHARATPTRQPCQSDVLKLFLIFWKFLSKLNESWKLFLIISGQEKNKHIYRPKCKLLFVSDKVKVDFLI